MSNNAIDSFVREGQWNSAYSFHYEAAWLCFYDFEEALGNLKTEEQRLISENVTFPKEDLNGFVRYETDILHTDAYRFAMSAHIFVCMAIEGFINYYGTVRLGEAIYKKVLERVGITEKLSLIYLLCFDEKLEPDCDLIKRIRVMFDQRNSLVHPKTKEITIDNLDKFEYVHPEKLPLEESFETLELFINDISTKDTNVHRGSHFKKPNKSIQRSFTR